jgi:hypothetical protein
MSRVVHFELPADDCDRAVKFYGKAFGWNLMKWDGPMEYWLVSTGDAKTPGIDGGLSRRKFPGEGISFTVDVESLDAALERVKAAGAEIVHPKGAIPGVGWLAYFKDPEGNVVGMMQQDPQAK